MCGIVGYWHPRKRYDGAVLERLVKTLSHRGPDDEGTWQDGEQGCALGHRRLSILDPSPLGHQPMTSPSGRYVISYNGEIYNFVALGTALEDKGVSFRSASDTEVLLAAVDEWGLLETALRINGIFAFALWDTEEKVLHLVRDRLGVKPLYLSETGDGVIFGSELKCLFAHPEFPKTLDLSALDSLLRYGYIRAPLTCFKNCRKVAPGTFFTIRKGLEGRLSVQETAYWSPGDALRQGLQAPFRGDAAQAVEALDALLLDSVRAQLVSDVPLGAFLSGGIDSSTVVCLMQQCSNARVKTFSIGFEEERYSEAHYAKQIAATLETDHTELLVTAEEAQETVAVLPEMFDEPFGDSSQIPMFLVSKLARRSVKVALSGDGGDELFGGYQRYHWALKLAKLRKHIPPALLRAGELASLAAPDAVWAFASRAGAGMRPHGVMQLGTETAYRKAALSITARDTQALYERLLEQALSGKDAAAGSEHARAMGASFLFARSLLSGGSSLLSNPPPPETFLRQMMYFDTLSYLPDDILVKVDRASMSVGLEARVPLLDHRVVEFAWTLPPSLLTSGGVAKYPLREVLKRYLPESLFDRPKMGFVVPVEEWVRGPLKPWAEDLIASYRNNPLAGLATDGILHSWDRFQKGALVWQPAFWSLLMLQAWRNHYSF